MKFLPYENFHIITKLTPGEAQAKLEGVVSAEGPLVVGFRGVSDGGLNTPFKGSSGNGKFQFKPNVIYHNSFLPQIKGSIGAYKGGSRIQVKMTLHPFITAIMSILLVGSGIAFLTLLPRLLGNKSKGTYMVPGFIFMFVYLLTIGAFKSESIGSKSFLLELLEGEIE